MLNIDLIFIFQEGFLIFFLIYLKYKFHEYGCSNEDYVYVSNSLHHPSSHFEAETELVLKMFKKITGKYIDLENLPEEVE